MILTTSYEATVMKNEEDRRVAALLLRNIPQLLDEQAEIAAVVPMDRDSFAMTGRTFLSHTGPFQGWGLAMTAPLISTGRAD